MELIFTRMKYNDNNWKIYKDHNIFCVHLDQQASYTEFKFACFIYDCGNWAKGEYSDKNIGYRDV